MLLKRNFLFPEENSLDAMFILTFLLCKLCERGRGGGEKDIKKEHIEI